MAPSARRARQEGHRGAGRELAPEDQVDEIVDHYPQAAAVAAVEFGEDERAAGWPVRAPSGLRAAADQRARGRASHAPAALPAVPGRTSAALPAGIGGSAFGPRLQAAIVTLTARQRISRRAATELAPELFGVGSRAARSTRSASAPQTRSPAPTRLRDWVLEQARCTSTRPAGGPPAIARRCGPRPPRRRVLPDRRALQPRAVRRADRPASRDRRLRPLARLRAPRPHQRQVCWSHLQRDFRRHSEGLAEQKTFGEHGLELTGRVFAAWRAYQHEHHDRARLQAEIAPIQTELRTLLEDAGRKSKRTGCTAASPTTCSRSGPRCGPSPPIDGVEPTNNPAERALRGPVIHRKLSHGTHTDHGERFAERALSAAATCRQHVKLEK